MLIRSRTYDADEIRDIQLKANIGRYAVRGFGSLRKFVHFDDLVFLPANLTRLVIDQYREPCNTKVVIGGKKGVKKPLILDTPIMIAPMSFGALSKNAKMALSKASAMVGTADSTGEGGMLPESRDLAAKLIYQCTPGRYGFNPHDLVRADAVEMLISQGAKPGVGGHLLSEKVTDEIAKVRGIPKGIDLRSPCRHADAIGADDLVMKVEELREATDWEVPIGLKLGAGRVNYDIKIIWKTGVDYAAIDGMQGGTGASPNIITEHIGIPTLPALVQAINGLKDIGKEDDLDVIIMGGIRNGADVGKALALGAKAVAVGTGALIAMGCIGCLQCHTGNCPIGIATQQPELADSLDVEEAAEKVANYVRALTSELEMFTRACGKTDVANLEKEDLRALTLEASLITGVPLVGRDAPFSI